ncbi:glutathione S-transferase family protein, partial [Hypericibacter sp.]|uniref:glutathione S-transferase family protein n=1 Tax=Hypericibacter sp. TaxID=2705401 RepID=UPI003D6D0E67
ATIPKAQTVLAALSDLMTGPYLLGAQLTLADLHLATIIAYFRLAPEGQQLLSQAPKIARWWTLMEPRPSLQQTRYPLELRS